jgi:hypothetical protein
MPYGHYAKHSTLDVGITVINKGARNGSSITPHVDSFVIDVCNPVLFLLGT